MSDTMTYARPSPGTPLEYPSQSTSKQYSHPVGRRSTNSHTNHDEAFRTLVNICASARTSPDRRSNWERQEGSRVVANDAIDGSRKSNMVPSVVELQDQSYRGRPPPPPPPWVNPSIRVSETPARAKVIEDVARTPAERLPVIRAPISDIRSSLTDDESGASSDGDSTSAEEAEHEPEHPSNVDIDFRVVTQDRTGTTLELPLSLLGRRKRTSSDPPEAPEPGSTRSRIPETALAACSTEPAAQSPFRGNGGNGNDPNYVAQQTLQLRPPVASERGFPPPWNDQVDPLPPPIKYICDERTGMLRIHIPPPPRTPRSTSQTKGFNSSVTSYATRAASLRSRKPDAQARFQCPHCETSLTAKHNYDRALLLSLTLPMTSYLFIPGHVNSHFGRKPFPCACGRSYTSNSDRSRHRKTSKNPVCRNEGAANS
ncbi:hypothetical protein HGRIS_004388 [Hohenbuehelia grisea]|uniref:C2H2-type domain-containing protein n=1 Tax=Hohenbuehelia grisea TaxID=104357 RepID=A0ABR3JBP0_9AGAR